MYAHLKAIIDHVRVSNKTKEKEEKSKNVLVIL